MLLIMNYLQRGVYEQCTGCVKTLEQRTQQSFCLPNKKNVDLRYHNSLCVSEACDRFILSFVHAVYYISGWHSDAMLITSL
jgi:hypothetical protein